MSGCIERFLCDEMLVRLGRWLRAAGYDVAIAEAGEEDRVLLQRAREEGRLFVTRDSQLQELRDSAGVVVLLEENQLAGQLRELSRLCNIDWLCHPFSRCLECNSELVAAEDAVKGRVPPEALREEETLLYCPTCDKPYWNGSHVRRMRCKLEQLSAGIWDGVVDEELADNNKRQK